MIFRTLMLRPLWKPFLMWISFFILFFLCLSHSLEARLYTYVDENGVLHITDFWQGGSPEAPSFFSRPSSPPPHLRELIHRESKAKGLDPKLVESLIRVESGFDPQAVSSKGAVGLMQLMPETARIYGMDNPWDVAQNVKAGTAYLRDLLYHFGGDLEKALAAYNAGPGAVKRHGGVPPYPETQRYVRRILSLYPAKKVKVTTVDDRGNRSPYRPIRRVRLPDGTVLYTNLPGS